MRRKLAIVATPPLQNAEGSSPIDQAKIKEETVDEQKQAPPSGPSVSPQSPAEKSQNTSSLADSPVKTNENNTGTEIVKPKGRPRGRPRKDSIVESTEKETTLESKKAGMTGEKFIILKGGKPIQSGQVKETGRNQGLQETKEKEQSKETTKEEKEDEDKEKGEKDEVTDNTTVTENVTKSAPRGRGRPRGRPRKNSGGRGRGGGRGEVVLQKQQEEMQKESTEKKEQHDDIKPSLHDEKTQKETADNETSTNDETENKQPKENFQTELRESNTESMDLETDQAEESTKAHLDANDSVAMEEAESEANGDSKRRKRKRTELDRLLSPSDFSVTIPFRTLPKGIYYVGGVDAVCNRFIPFMQLGRSTSTRRTFTSVIAGLTKTEEGNHSSPAYKLPFLPR